MGLHMMDGHERPPQTESGGLRPANTHQQRSDEAGPGGDGHSVDIAQRPPSLDQRTVDHLVDTLYVGTRRDLRNYTAVQDVLILRVDHMAFECVWGLQHCCGGLVTACFESQNERIAHCSTRLTETVSTDTTTDT